MRHKRFHVGGRALSLFLAISMIAIPLLAESQAAVVQGNDYTQGRVDGERDSKGSPLWLLGGLICGVFAVVYCYVQSPTPPVGALIGKTAEYVLGYSDGYKTKRGKDAIYAWVGWGVWVVVYLVAVLPKSNTSD